MDVELSQSEQERYAEQIAFEGLGVRGQERLKQLRVLVVGAGPVGAAIAGQLASAGVGYLGVVDGGAVALRDLASQTVHFAPDVGTNKAGSVAGKLGVLNSEVQVDPYPVWLDADNADAIVIGHDLVVASLSDEQARLQVNDACVRAGVPLIDCAAAGSKLAVQTVGELQGACLRCEGMATAHAAGVAPGIAGLAGSIAATEALRLLIEPDETEHQTTFDLATGVFERNEVSRRDDCEACSPSASAPVEEMAT